MRTRESKCSIGGVTLVLIILAFFIFGSTLAHADSPRFRWAQRHGNQYYDMGKDVVADDHGNCYVVGDYAGGVGFSPYSLQSLYGGQDVFIVKIGSWGSARWVQRIGGSNVDEGCGITLDNDGNVIVTGYFTNSAYFYNAYSYQASDEITGNGQCMYVAKYNGVSGNLIWAKKSDAFYGADVAVDANNNIYVIGSFGDGQKNSVTFGSNTLTTKGDNDVFIAKYNSAGDAQWGVQIGGPGADWGYGIAVDKWNNLFVTGGHEQWTDFHTTRRYSIGGSDMFLASYSSGGGFRWVQVEGQTGTDIGWDVTTDGEGKVIVVGEFEGTNHFGSGGNTTTLVSAGMSDAFTAKYTNLGDLEWAKRFGGTRADGAKSVDIDHWWNVYVAGFYTGQAQFGGSIHVGSYSDTDCFIAKYGRNSSEEWMRGPGGAGEDRFNGVAVNRIGYSYLIGGFTTTLYCETRSLSSLGDYDIVIAELNNEPETDASVWWTHEVDYDEDGYKRSAMLHWRVVDDNWYTYQRYAIRLYCKPLYDGQWTEVHNDMVLINTKEDTCEGYIVLEGPEHDDYNFFLEIYDYTSHYQALELETIIEWNEDLDFNDYEMEQATEDDEVECAYYFTSGQQGWGLRGAYDNYGNGLLDHNFELYPSSVVTYPYPDILEPPIGEGSLCMLTTGPHAVSSPGAQYWVMQIHSPDLSDCEAWQQAGGYTAAIMHNLSATAPIYANLVVRVYDVAEARDRWWVNEFTAPQLTYGEWMTQTLNWDEDENFPTNCIIREVYVQIWGHLSDSYDPYDLQFGYRAKLYVDNVVPFESTSTNLAEPINLLALQGYDGAVPLAWNPPATSSKLSGTAGLKEVDSPFTPPHEINMEMQPFKIIEPTYSGGLIDDIVKNNPSFSGSAIHEKISLQNLTGYNVYRSTSAGGPYTTIAANVTHQYYRDEPVQNGQSYYYAITAVYDEGESQLSAEVLGQPVENGYYIYSGWNNAQPTIDGTISFTEWKNAATIPITYPGMPPDSVTLHVMNNDEYLWIAITDRNDDNLLHGDQAYFFFDKDRNRDFPAASPSDEGNFAIAYESGSTNSYVRAIHGYWPNNLTVPSYSSATGVTSKIAAGPRNQSIHYEMQINLTTSMLDIAPGDIIGAVFGTYDINFGRFNGAWPQEAEELWDFMSSTAQWGKYPFAFGDLELATQPVIDEATVRIDPDTKEIDLDETGTTDVVIDNVTYLGGFEFTINYDKDIVQIASQSDVVLGPFLGSTGRTALPIATNINNTTGSLVFSAASFTGPTGPRGASGSGVLATITWTPQSEGVSLLDLNNSQVTDDEANVIPTIEADGEIEVTTGFWADVDGDNDVDIVDIQAVAAHYGTQVGDPGYDPQYDMDGDGDIDIVDIQMVAAWYGADLSGGKGAGKLFSAQAAPPVSLTLNWAKGTDKYIVEVGIDGVVNLGGFQCDVTSSDNALEISSFQVGEFLKSTNNHILSFGPIVNKDKGWTQIAALNYGNNPAVSGSGVIARIELSKPVSVLNLENVQIVDRFGNIIKVMSIVNNLNDVSAAMWAPKQYTLQQNYPNPFNPTTNIKYQIAEKCQVIIKVYSVVGQEIRTLINEEKEAGFYTAHWDGRDEFGRNAANGVYIYSIKAGDFFASRKMILLK